MAPARTGGDLTVKMWRVFPYAEESLSPLRTFCCCHPAVVLCALGKRVTVGFEDPNRLSLPLCFFQALLLPALLSPFPSPFPSLLLSPLLFFAPCLFSWHSFFI